MARGRPIWHNIAQSWHRSDDLAYRYDGSLLARRASRSTSPREEMMISQAVIAQAAMYRQAFQAAQPFKHVFIDDFFVNAAAEASLRDFPPFERQFCDQRIRRSGRQGGCQQYPG